MCKPVDKAVAAQGLGGNSKIPAEVDRVGCGSVTADADEVLAGSVPSHYAASLWGCQHIGALKT